MTDTYSIPPPNTPLVDNRGFITRVWWRFLSSLFVTTGGGTAGGLSLTGLQTQIAALQGLIALLLMPRGTDYARQISDLQISIATLPKTASGGGSSGSVSSSSIYAPLVNGDLPGPTLVADGQGQCIMVPIA